MTVIGRSKEWLHQAAGSSPSSEQAAAPRVHSLLDSLTHSLELAARGYLCAPLVDCDPVIDPECSSSGKKLQFPQTAKDRVTAMGTQEAGAGPPLPASGPSPGRG